MQGQLLAAPVSKQKNIRSRIVTVTHSSQQIIDKNHRSQSLAEFVELEGDDEYVLVPKKLIGDKLLRYFSESSSAVVAMSCCPEIQVHRKCLRDMFHAKEHRCSDACPGCFQKIDKRIFAKSRAHYILGQFRKKSCDFCKQSLHATSFEK